MELSKETIGKAVTLSKCVICQEKVTNADVVPTKEEHGNKMIPPETNKPDGAGQLGANDV